MNMPGFTAEATLYRGGRRYGEEQAALASKNDADILPALPTGFYSPGRLRGFCANRLGLFWPPGAESNTYGCLLPDGHGVVCGGDTQDHQTSCDKF